MNTNRSTAGGVVLIVVGLALLISLQTGQGGVVIPAVIGVAFLIGFAFNRAYGLLVPGMILTGLGLGIIVESNLAANGGAVVLGLGAGFLGIYLVNLFLNGPVPYWPLIPGGVLTLVGAMLLLQGTPGARVVEQYWPALLILLGIALLARLPRGRSGSPTP